MSYVAIILFLTDSGADDAFVMYKSARIRMEEKEVPYGSTIKSRTVPTILAVPISVCVAIYKVQLGHIMFYNVNVYKIDLGTELRANTVKAFRCTGLLGITPYEVFKANLSRYYILKTKVYI